MAVGMERGQEKDLSREELIMRLSDYSYRSFSTPKNQAWLAILVVARP
jgi:hypothetical protein